MTISNAIKFKNSYAKELHEICERCVPSGFNKSEIVLKNYILAKELGLSKKFVESKECLEIFPPKHNVDGMFAARLKKYAK